MKTFFAAAMAAAASAKLLTNADYKFLEFVVEYGKNYATSEEFEARKEHFKNFFAAVQEINSDPEMKHTAGINAHSANTPEEWDRMLGLKNMPAPELHGGQHEVLMASPSSVDWRTSGDVTAVKDQGNCGSCWAFSSTEALESANSIFHGSLPQLSEQQLVDCSGSFNNGGCNGGWYYWSYDYLASGKSLETESQYPYTARDGTCKNSSGSGNVSATGYNEVSGTSTAIKSAIAQQPVNVAVAAGNYYFQSYSGGILMASGCPTRIDHAIVAVGYGNSNGTDYYIVRNSWGTSWGDKGYIMMEATSSGKGTCGINQNVAYPTGV